MQISLIERSSSMPVPMDAIQAEGKLWREIGEFDFLPAFSVPVGKRSGRAVPESTGPIGFPE